MAIEIGIRELRDALSETIARVEAGEPVTVTRHGRPVAVVLPYGTPPALARLVSEGRIRWSGRPLRAAPPTLTLKGEGPTLSDYVSEDRR